MDLKEYIRSHTPKGFTPRPMYNRDFDCVEWYWSDEHAYADPVHVDGVWVGCVMRSMATDIPVGVKVFGMAKEITV